MMWQRSCSYFVQHSVGPSHCRKFRSPSDLSGLGRAGSHVGRSISSAACCTAAKQQTLAMAVAFSRYFVGAAGRGLSARRLQARPEQAVPLPCVEKAGLVCTKHTGQSSSQLKCRTDLIAPQGPGKVFTPQTHDNMPSNFKQYAKPQAAQHEAAKSAIISGRQPLRLRAAAGHPGWVMFILSILAAWQLAPKQGWHNISGSRRIGPANGVFPVGCKWRDVEAAGLQRGFWDVTEYEYWSQQLQAWVSKMPDACMVRGETGAPGWFSDRMGSPRSEVNCSDTHCIYQNLWYNNGRFYLLVDGPEHVKGWDMTRNQKLHVLHVDSAEAFARGQVLRHIKGDTLLFDFVYFLHPTAIGHWGGTMFPLFSILKREGSFAWPPAQFVLLHLKRVHLMEWVRAVVATTLGVPHDGALPPIIMQQEVPSIWDQIPSPLEGFDSSAWVRFERALVVRDIFTGGRRTFFSRADAQDFRARIYARNGLPSPQKRVPLPRQITFQRKRANRQVVNEEQLLALLGEFGEVRVVEFNASTPFKEQLEVMASSAVLVSVHTSNLANAQFLQPGSAVVELIQRNWIWHNLDRSFQVQTEVMGDIHHYAWRARFRNQTVYINKRDSERFGDWASQQCSTEDCVEAHTNVHVVVNVDELRALLQDRMPLVFAGASVGDAALPWPSPD